MSQVTILGEDARHIAKSLRMRPGDEVTLCDGNTDYYCRIERLDEGSVEVVVLYGVPCVSEPILRVNLYMALPKGEKIEYMLQKSVELGAASLNPFIGERCISRPSAESGLKKLSRWHRICEEAAKQCGRGRIPEVSGILSFEGALRACVQNDLPIFLYENEKKISLRTVLEERLKESLPKTVGVMIGPEGGFSPEEAKRALEAGMISASLGRRILRCETVPGCVLSVLMYVFNEMEI